jgi:hypothetical protein
MSHKLRISLVALCLAVLPACFGQISEHPGSLRFAFEVRPGSPEHDDAFSSGYGDKSKDDPHCPSGLHSAECLTFHYTIHNLNEQTVLLLTTSCSRTSIFVEYRRDDDSWKSLPMPMWTCRSNGIVQQKIEAGDSFDGAFTLRHLKAGWDTTPLQEAATYHFRFTLSPDACVAASDGKSCVGPLERPTSVIATEVVVNADAAY